MAYIGHPLVGDPLYDIGGKPKVCNSQKNVVPGDCGYYLHRFLFFYFLKKIII